MLKTTFIDSESEINGSLSYKTKYEETYDEGIKRDFGSFTTVRSCGFGKTETRSSYFIVTGDGNSTEQTDGNTVGSGSVVSCSV